MDDLKTLEYRVREKTVYFVTRYCVVGDGHGSLTEEGEFKDALIAQRAAVALCAQECADKGLHKFDDRVVWPADLVYGEPTSDAISAMPRQ